MKRDLNLIPKKVRTGHIAAYLLPIFIFLLVASIGGYLGITIPNNIRDTNQTELNSLQGQIDALADIGERHEQALVELNALKIQEGTFSKLVISDPTPLHVLLALENASPEEIIMENISYGDAIISISGKTPDDVTLARLLVGVQRTGIFKSFYIVSTSDLANRSFALSDGEEGLGKTFSISIQLFSTQPVVEEGSEEE